MDGTDDRRARTAVLDAASAMLVAGERLSIARIARSTRLSRRAVRLQYATTDRMIEAIAVAVTQKLVGDHPRLHPHAAVDEWHALMAAIWQDAALVRALLIAGQQRTGSALGDLLQPLLWSKTAIIARGQEQGLFRTDRAAQDLGIATQRACLAALLEPGGDVSSATTTTLRILQPVG